MLSALIFIVFFMVFRLLTQAKNLTFADVVLYVALGGMTAFVYMNYEKLGIELLRKNDLIIVNCVFLATAIWSFFDGAFTFLLIWSLLSSFNVVENPVVIGLICGVVVMVIWWAAAHLKDGTLKTICRVFYWTFSVVLSLLSALAYAVVAACKNGVITHPVLAAGIFIISSGALLATRKASLYTRTTKDLINITYIDDPFDD